MDKLNALRNELNALSYTELSYVKGGCHKRAKSCRKSYRCKPKPAPVNNCTVDENPPAPVEEPTYDTAS